MANKTSNQIIEANKIGNDLEAVQEGTVKAEKNMNSLLKNNGLAVEEPESV